MRRLLLAVLAVCCLAPTAPARGAEAVDVALVLVSDVSRSINDDEFKLQKDGYVAAFGNPAVVGAIKSGPLGAIAVAYVEFASSFEVKTIVDWTTINDRASAMAFAARVAAAPRSAWGRTAIGAGIDLGVKMLDAYGDGAQRRVLDVCGDGTNNNGRDVREARDEALAKGIVINGLTIINLHPTPWSQGHVNPPGGLTNYYRENVTGGPGSFVLEINEFPKFGEAMTRKLVLEIAGLAPASDYAAAE